MTAKEYNEIDNTYEIIENKTIEYCDRNKVGFYNYLGEFKILLKNYIVNKNKIEVVKDLSWDDPIKVRSILNTRNFGDKLYEIKKCTELFEKAKTDLFSWLDNVKEPYFFILNPIYYYGAWGYRFSNVGGRYGYKKESFTGIQNLDIAVDYSLYKLRHE